MAHHALALGLRMATLIFFLGTLKNFYLFLLFPKTIRDEVYANNGLLFFLRCLFSLVFILRVKSLGVKLAKTNYDNFLKMVTLLVEKLTKNFEKEYYWMVEFSMNG